MKRWYGMRNLEIWKKKVRFDPNITTVLLFYLLTNISFFLEKELISYCSQMVETRLPKTVSRGKKESDVVGLASQAFNVSSIGENIPGWISGHLLLPPRAIKDAEGVGLCSQVFFVGDCQPGSIEFSLANPEENEYLPATAQRFLLSKGDFFHVPPGNVYRLENHSRTTECKVFCTIIRSF